jgi:hypothetical protein
MRLTPTYLAPLLAAAATAVAIAAAPMAAAAPAQISASGGAGTTGSTSITQPQQSCLSLGGTQSQCQSPGNAQIYDAPPQVDYFPYAGGAT